MFSLERHANSTQLVWDGSGSSENLTDYTDLLPEGPLIQIESRSVESSLGATALYLLGTLGNVAALLYLLGAKTKPRNPKHALMLRSLAANDLLAVLGMWGQMTFKTHLPHLARSVGFCAFRVIWRTFGLGSGCVVIVMAVERWFALTRPFFYQKHVTLSSIRRSIIGLWLAVLVLVSMPLLGFGVYYDPETNKCVRYKLATKPIDKAYAYVYMAFALLLCLCMVWCNLGVARALVVSRKNKRQEGVLVRRISRNRDLTQSASTQEELAFARIMTLLCIVFVLCWFPQLVSIPLAQVFPNSPGFTAFLNLADLLLALHFIVDPYFYVLQRWPILRSLCRKSAPSRANSMKTSHELCSL